MKLTLRTTRNGSELVDTERDVVLERRNQAGQLTFANLPNHRRPDGYFTARANAKRVRA